VAAGRDGCIACGADYRARCLLHNGALLLQCPRCRLATWAWQQFDPSAFYDATYFQGAGDAKGYDDYAALHAGLERTARGRLRRLGRMLAGAGIGTRRLLEIGCGTGVFLRVAQEAGWDVRGVEVSRYAADQARAAGLLVDCAPLEEVDLPPASFDAVVLWDTIEHLPQPAETLAGAARLLRPGGVLALSTGDVTSLCARLSGADWHLFTLPEHLWFFSPAALRRLLARQGCSPARVTREVFWVPLCYIAERLRKSPSGASRAVAALVGLLPESWRARWVIPATLFDVLGVYARRR
jgi:SAM-dependent methyltransferase